MDERNIDLPLNEREPAPQETKKPLEEISCAIEQITFRSEQTLYTVVKARDLDSQRVLTAVGEFASCAKGEDFTLQGYWHDHPKYGLQFNVVRASSRPPSTIEGIEKYIGSGIIPGIGKGFAKKIVRKFGQKTLEIIEKSPKKLRQVKGLGKGRIDNIVKFCEERSRERDAMLFLYSHGITPGFAAKILRRYGAETAEAIRQNPYRLAEDISGIGFKTADRLAMNLGISGRSPERIRAALLHALSEAESEGHCFLLKDQILEFTAGMISVDLADVEHVLRQMVSAGELIPVPSPGVKETFEPAECIYGRSLHRTETECAAMLEKLIRTAPAGELDLDAEKEIAAVQQALRITFAPMQKEAILKAIRQKVSIITGGPGTGKTTIIRAIVSIFRKMRQRVLLCAPTGRAAKRLSEATGRDARTIHRTLRWNVTDRTFEFNETSTLEADMVIVDEMSMVDIRLLNNLLRALDPRTRLLVVGDADQLPSVGPGSVLRDLLRSGVPAATRLDEIFRQAASSMIISNAHRINKGIMPAFQPEEGQVQDFFFIDRDEPEAIAEAVIEMAAARIPSKYSLDPLSGIQVLAPMHKGIIGVQALNERLSKCLNAEGQRIGRAGEPVSVGDKVMQTRNNYDLEVFNGDIGIVSHWNPDDSTMTVDFDGRLVRYNTENAGDLVKAFAISIHKSQGSEYEAVVVPVSTSHYIMLQRNLIYTAITRARKLVVLVGTKKALAIAVKNDKVRERNTLLAQFLSGKIDVKLLQD